MGFRWKRKVTLREIYAYYVLAHLVQKPEQKSTGCAIAQSLSVPFNATFYRACEHMVCMGFLNSEGSKGTKRYWLADGNHERAQRACLQWANELTGSP